MNEPRNEEEFSSRAKALFDESVDDLDAAALSRLNRARQRALEELDRSRPAGQWARWMPAAGVAAAAVVAVVTWQGIPVESPALEKSSVTDFEILMGEESLEMLEDLEFYGWIGTLDAKADGNVG